MDEQLMPVGLEVVLDSILNRVSSNRFSGKKTVIIVEELHMYLRYQYSAEFSTSYGNESESATATASESHRM